MSWGIPLDEVVTFDEVTQAADRSAVDADSTPTFSVFEEATDTPILADQNFTKRTSLTGNYRGTFTMSAANGFEVGKWYNVISSATVGGVAGKKKSMTFRCAPAESQAGYPKVDIAYVAGTIASTSDGTATAGGASTITLATGVSYGTDVLKGREIRIEGGTGEGQARWIAGNTNATPSVVTVHRAWDVQPDNTSTYVIDHTAEVDASASAVASVTGAVGSVTDNVNAVLADTTHGGNSARLKLGGGDASNPSLWATNSAGIGAFFESTAGTESTGFKASGRIAGIHGYSSTVGSNRAGILAEGLVGAGSGNYGFLAMGGLGGGSFLALGTDKNGLVLAGTGTGDDLHLSDPSTNLVLAKTTNITGFNDLSAADVNAEADTALADVGLTTTITGRIDAAVSTRASQSSVDDVPTNAELATAIITGLTTALTEGYRGTGATGSVRDLLYELIAHLGNSGIASVTKTLKKLDKATTAKTFTIDDAGAPTAIEETT